MEGKGRRYPFPITLILIVLLFGRKKKPDDSQKQAAGLQSLAAPVGATIPVPESLHKSVTEGDMARARDKLRVASLERDIIGDALTKIYEAEARGQITDLEKGQLLQRYKVDLKRVDGEIDVQKRIVDLHELESAKEDLLKSFYEKLMEIDLRIGQLKPGLESIGQDQKQSKPTSVPANTPPSVGNKQESSETQANEQQTPQKERPARERPKSKAEERLEAVREEVLKAMERLEQIETEG